MRNNNGALLLYRVIEGAMPERARLNQSPVRGESSFGAIRQFALPSLSLFRYLVTLELRFAAAKIFFACGRSAATGFFRC